MISDRIDLPLLFARYRSVIDASMRSAIPSAAPVAEIYDLLRYHLGWLDASLQPTVARTGKKIRPTICLLCCDAANGDARKAVPVAVALELLHNFSLIHDDVEDRGSERWGRPTVWARWGDALAINSGDAMLILSELALLGVEKDLGASVALRMLRVLNECSLRLTEGQHLDISLERNLRMTRDQYWKIIAGKTAALLGCSCQLGALAAGVDEERAHAFRVFGEQVGFAFQIQDDVLGIWGEPVVTGKPAAADIRGHKVTLPVIAALERATASIAERISAVYRADAPTDDAVAEVVSYFDVLGVRALAESEAEGAVGRALAALELAAPIPPHGDELRALTFSLLGRTA